MDALAKDPNAVTMFLLTVSPDVIWALNFEVSVEREGELPGIRHLC